MKYILILFIDARPLWDNAFCGKTGRLCFALTGAIVCQCLMSGVEPKKCRSKKIIENK